MGKYKVNLKKMDKSGRYFGAHYKGIAWITNGHWLIKYDPRLMELEPALAAHLEGGKGFSNCSGSLDLSGGSLPQLGLVLDKASMASDKHTGTKIAIVDGDLFSRLYVSESGEAVQVDQKFLDLLGPVLDEADAIVGSSDATGKDPLVFRKGGEILAVIMPIRPSAPDFLVMALKREARLTKGESVAA